jgi:glycosyltransferase A (GT-A) superfamily protein (DUF2064 family)
MRSRLLVVAKAPVTGEAKTRLGATVGMEAAADLAAAALLDTVAAGRQAFAAPERFVALTGDLAAAARRSELADELAHWQVFEQRGDGFDERLAAAYADLPGVGPVIQIGMDTPQVSPADLRAAGAGLADADAVLGPADDGGWWVLALRRASDAAALVGVEMSVPTTYDATWRALSNRGLRVAGTTTLRDVDEVSDARAVAAAYPDTAFARAWRRASEREVLR